MCLARPAGLSKLRRFPKQPGRVEHNLIPAFWMQRVVCIARFRHRETLSPEANKYLSKQFEEGRPASHVAVMINCDHVGLSTNCDKTMLVASSLFK